MVVWLITFGCLVAYVVGLFLLVRIMPRLIKRAVDDALFIGVAALAILGAMLAFGAIGVTFALFSGTLGVKIMDALLLLILGIITLRTSVNAFSPPRYANNQNTNRASRVMTGSFFLLLTIAAAALLFLLFVPA